MKTIPTIFLFLASTLVLCGQSRRVTFIFDAFDVALERAQKEKKLVFIDTYAAWCKPCKKQEPVFRDNKVAKLLNENFINVKVDMDKQKGKLLANKYSVVFLPTLLILDELGNVKYRSDQSFKTQILSAEELYAIANGVLMREQGISPPAHTVATATPSTQAKPKYRHVQHTPLNKSAPKKADAAVQSEVPAKMATIQSEPESEGKILHVLGQGEELPPPVLREEAYFRLSLMDGSHVEASKKYLTTQEDWSTDENMKFLFDFLYTTRSDEFNYLILNRHKFENLIGKTPVKTTIEILVNQTLDRGFPQPDKKEAQALYSYIDPSNSRKNATSYYLNRLYVDREIDLFIPEAKQYLKDVRTDDADMMIKLANVLSEYSDDRNTLNDAIELIDNVIKIQGLSYAHLDSKAYLYYKLKDKNKASKMANQAISLAKQERVDYSSTLELLSLIDNL